MSGRLVKGVSTLLGAIVVLALIALGATVLAPTLNPSPPPALTPAGSVNHVGLIVLPDDGESAIADKVSRARQRVLMKGYLLTDTRLIDALKGAQANGADVKVMIEQQPLGGSNAAKTAYDALKKASIAVKYASPAFRFSHEKSFVIDDVALILTSNMTRSSVTRNREFGVQHDNPADVAEIVAAFDADWDRKPFAPASPNLVWSPTNSRDRLTGLIHGARTSLDVYAASAQDDGLIEALSEAVRRGVRVRALASPPRGEDAEEGSDEDLDRLQRAGAEVRLLKSPYVHAKVLVADGARAFVGSQNISATSLDFNRELGLIFHDLNAIGRIEATFQKDWNKATER